MSELKFGVYTDIEEAPLFIIMPIEDEAHPSDPGIPIMPLAAPAPIANTTVPAADLNLFVGSGAHDFIAYRTATDTSYCIYPVRIDAVGRVTSNGLVNTISVRTVSGSRTVSYGSDDINRQLTGSSIHYSDLTGRYLTAWATQSYKTPLDYVTSYVLIAACLASLLGSLIRGFRRG